MEKDKIIIAGSKDVFIDIKNRIETSDFTLIDSSLSGNETIRKATTLFPDIVITDYTLSDMTGLGLAKAIEHLRICPVIVLANPTQSGYVEDIKSNSLDIFCIVKPINNIVLNHTISLIMKLSKKIHEYEFQIDDLKHQLEDRKLIEKAKGILMKKFNMSEDEAYKEMRKKAMDSSKPLPQIAKTIIEMFKTFA